MIARSRSSLPALLAMILVPLAGEGCGGGDQTSLVAPGPGGTHARMPNMTADTYMKGDDDSDEPIGSERHGPDYDDRLSRAFGRPAGADDAHAVTALVGSYYATATAANGAGGCSLIYAGLRQGARIGELAERLYPPAPGAPPLADKSCAYVLSTLFRERHRQLAHDSAGMKVTAVRVEGRRGIALLAFKTSPERQMPVRREGRIWKIDALLDKEIL